MSDGKDSTNGGGAQDKPQNKKPLGFTRRSRSSDAEGSGREGRQAERKRDQAERRKRGRSEERRGSSHRTNTVDDLGDDTECMVCFCAYDNVFKAPKVLACGHTFCLECLARINVTSPKLKSLTCPVCRNVTELPHGRDLPHLDNNKDIFRKLPPGMQRALSVRFKRNKGKLVLKKPPSSAFSSPCKSSLTLPSFKKKENAVHPAQDSNTQQVAIELGLAPGTTIDVGRPPSRVRERLRNILRSNRCYYAVVAAIILITVALMLVGILAFVVMPNVMTQVPSSSTSSSLDRP